MRELEVLGDSHLKLALEERKEFFEEELKEQVLGGVKQLLERSPGGTDDAAGSGAPLARALAGC